MAQEKTISKNLLKIVVQNYGFDENTLRFLSFGKDRSKEFYIFTKREKDYVLRVDHCPYWYMAQTKAEMDWISYLEKKGINVAAPLKTVGGELCILGEENGVFSVISSFSKAKGRLWDKNNPALWNEKIFYNWGRTMGLMHWASKDYKVSDGVEKRPAYENIILNTVKGFPSVDNAAKEITSEIKALPKDRDSYGLIHCDLHPNNFMIDQEQITVFDFADCKYAWYAMDIGVALAVGLWLGQVRDNGYDFTNHIIKYFLQGYISANVLDDFWRGKIPLFMRLCQISLFSYICDTKGQNDSRLKEQIFNIENNIFLTGCAIDYNLFL